MLRNLQRLRATALALPLVTVACGSTRPPPSQYRDAAGQCWEHVHMDCPSNATCNPPPPRRIECPNDLSKLSHDDFEPVVKPDAGSSTDL